MNEYSHNLTMCTQITIRNFQVLQITGHGKNERRGNEGEREKSHLTAGEEEILAAVVPPGDYLAAVQAHLQCKPTNPAAAKPRQNHTKASNAKPIGQ